MILPPEPSTIRIAHAADATAMAALSRDLIERGLGWKYTAERITELIRDPQTVALVASRDKGAGSKPEGMAVMRFDDEHAHLVLLCVAAASQRRGLGQALLNWLLESARVGGMATVHLELRADNASARSFYDGLGFNEAGCVADYYARNVDARRMVLALRRPIAQA